MTLAEDMRADLREAYKAGDIEMAEYLVELRKLRQGASTETVEQAGPGHYPNPVSSSAEESDKDKDEDEGSTQDSRSSVHFGDSDFAEGGEDGEDIEDQAEDKEGGSSGGRVCLGRAHHDLLGEGTIVAIFDTKEHTEDAAASFDDAYNKGKVYFRFTKREKVGRSWKEVVKSRWVHEDACEPIREHLSSGDKEMSARHTPAERTVFDHMEHAAQQDYAFTEGMEPVELAWHERKRKLKRLKEAPVRGRNMSSRKTKEPKVPVSLRIEQFPDNGFIEDCGELYCKPCCTTVSAFK